MEQIIAQWTAAGPVQPLGPGVWQVGNGAILKEYKNFKQLDRNLLAMRRLKAAGVPVPTIIPTSGGADYCELAERRYCMMTRLPGSPGALHDLMLYEAGRALGQLHIAFQRIDDGTSYWDNSLLREMQGWVRAGFKTHPCPWVTGDELDQSIQQLESYEPCLPRQLIHRDVHFGNFLFDSGHFSGYIDFDLSQRNIRLFDPCYLLLGLLLENGGNQVKPEDWPLAIQQVLQGYDELIPLTQAEKDAIPCVMACIELLCTSYFLGHGEMELARGAADLFHLVRDQEPVIRAAVEEGLAYSRALQGE